MQININNLNQRFVGDFENSAFRTKDFEVAVKFYIKQEIWKKSIYIKLQPKLS
jgi:hypothetical protein